MQAKYVRMRRALRSSRNNVLIPLTSLLFHECVENFVGVTISEELTQSKQRRKEPSLVIGQFDRHQIRHLHISHKLPYLPPKILQSLCFSFLLGIEAIPRGIQNNAYAKFWEANEVHPGRCASGELSEWELKTEEMIVLMPRLKQLVRLANFVFILQL